MRHDIMLGEIITLELSDRIIGKNLLGIRLQIKMLGDDEMIVQKIDITHD